MNGLENATLNKSIVDLTNAIMALLKEVMHALHGDAEYKEAADTLDSLQAQVEVLKSALESCVDDIIAAAVFEGTPRFEAERSAVVVNARAALTQVQPSPDANKETKV